MTQNGLKTITFGARYIYTASPYKGVPPAQAPSELGLLGKSSF